MTELADASTDLTAADPADASSTEILPDELADETVFARFAEPTADTPTRIAVLADPHVSTRHDGTWKVFHRSEDRVRAAVADAETRDADGIVFAGDLTKDGFRDDFDAVHDAIADASIPTVAVPGNHDVPKNFEDRDVPSLAEFEDRFTDDGLPFIRRIGGVDIIGLNTASAPDGSLQNAHTGIVSDDQLEWLESVLPEAQNPIVVMHHNLTDAMSKADGPTWGSSEPVANADTLAALLDEHDVPMHVSAHLHVPEVFASGGVRELICPALGSFPGAYLLFEIDDTGTTIRYVPVTDADGVQEAYDLAMADSERSQTVATRSLEQLADAPLLEEDIVVPTLAD